jgi:ribose transport system permease protein
MTTDTTREVRPSEPLQPAPPAMRSPEEQRPGRLRSVWHHSERFALLVAWGLVVLAFSIALPAIYPTAGNFTSILGSQAVLLVLALGLLFPLTAGEFDLSVASTLSLSAMVIAVLNTQLDVPIGAAVLAGVVCGLVVGLVNGLLVVYARLDSFIATLGTATVMLGLIQWMSAGTSVTGIDPALVQATVGFRGIGGMPLQFYYGVIATIIVTVLLIWTPIGRRLLFVGRGRQVAYLSGLNVDRLRIGAFVGSGVTAALAGVLYAGALGGADPASGQSFMLPAFAACFLGATAIIPGRFNAIGTFIAVYFLASGVVGLQMLGAQNFVQQLFYGGALIVAVALSQMIRRNTTRNR